MEDFIIEEGFKRNLTELEKDFRIEKIMKKRIIDVFERMYTSVMTTKNPDERERLVDCMIRLYQAVKPEPMILTEKVSENKNETISNALLIVDAILILMLLVTCIASNFAG